MCDITLEVKCEDRQSRYTFMDIPSKPLKQLIDIIGIPLIQIWNKEVIDNQKFPIKLKYADIAQFLRN